MKKISHPTNTKQSDRNTRVFSFLYFAECKQGNCKKKKKKKKKNLVNRKSERTKLVSILGSGLGGVIGHKY